LILAGFAYLFSIGAHNQNLPECFSHVASFVFGEVSHPELIVSRWFLCRDLGSFSRQGVDLDFCDLHNN
jgi:hypothetical protein